MISMSAISGNDRINCTLNDVYAIIVRYDDADHACFSIRNLSNTVLRESADTLELMVINMAAIREESKKKIRSCDLDSAILRRTGNIFQDALRCAAVTPDQLRDLPGLGRVCICGRNVP